MTSRRAEGRLTGLALAALIVPACASGSNETGESPQALLSEVALVPATDPAPPCDRWGSDACAPTHECRVAARRHEDAAAFGVYATCLPRGTTLPAGAPCEPWGGGRSPVSIPGLHAELFVDPCEAGLVCTSTILAPRDYRCRASCDLAVDRRCPSDEEYCYVGATDFQSSCIPMDRCDPTLREGCGDGIGCYVRPNDTVTGIVTQCLPVATDAPLSDGSRCASSLDCRPGSLCWGPSFLRPGSWLEEQQLCRRACDASYDDAAVCDPGLICRELFTAREVLDFSRVPVPLGQCEDR